MLTISCQQPRASCGEGVYLSAFVLPTSNALTSSSTPIKAVPFYRSITWSLPRSTRYLAPDFHIPTIITTYRILVRETKPSSVKIFLNPELTTLPLGINGNPSFDTLRCDIDTSMACKHLDMEQLRILYWRSETVLVSASSSFSTFGYACQPSRLRRPRKSLWIAVVKGSTALRDILHMPHGQDRRQRDKVVVWRPLEGCPKRWTDPMFQVRPFDYDGEKMGWRNPAGS